MSQSDAEQRACTLEERVADLKRQNEQLEREVERLTSVVNDLLDEPEAATGSDKAFAERLARDAVVLRAMRANNDAG